MQTLILMAWASIPITGVLVGFICGVTANFFGFDFLHTALVTGAAASGYQAGRVFS